MLQLSGTAVAKGRAWRAKTIKTTVVCFPRGCKCIICNLLTNEVQAFYLVIGVLLREIFACLEYYDIMLLFNVGFQYEIN